MLGERLEPEDGRLVAVGTAEAPFQEDRQGHPEPLAAEDGLGVAMPRAALPRQHRHHAQGAPGGGGEHPLDEREQQGGAQQGEAGDGQPGSGPHGAKPAGKHDGHGDGQALDAEHEGRDPHVPDGEGRVSDDAWVSGDESNSELSDVHCPTRWDNLTKRSILKQNDISVKKHGVCRLSEGGRLPCHHHQARRGDVQASCSPQRQGAKFGRCRGGLAHGRPGNDGGGKFVGAGGRLSKSNSRMILGNSSVILGGQDPLPPVSRLPMKFLAVLLLPAAALHAADVDWPVYLGDKASSHYSTLEQVTPENVGNMEQVWSFASGGADGQNRSQIQCNPLVVGGVLFGTSPDFQLFAVDAATGVEKWRFDPAKEGLPKSGVNRGLVSWGTGDEARIFYANDRFLHAIDPRTGKRIGSFGKQGSVDLKEGLGREAGDLYLTANTPGVIFGDLLIMGMRLGEGPAPAAPGPIRAYNVRTGELVWRFNTMPQPGEPGHETWPPEAFKSVGGANVWTGFALDEARGLVFCPTGSAAFDFWGGDRTGQNLYANCLIALDAKTGKRVWHFQFVHHDLWDRDLPAPPNLLTVTHGGKKIDAVAQVTKSGHVFVFDRETGEPLFPIEEKPVPPSDVQGESAWPTQPFPLKPAPFARQLFSRRPDHRHFPGVAIARAGALQQAAAACPLRPAERAGNDRLSRLRRRRGVGRRGGGSRRRALRQRQRDAVDPDHGADQGGRRSRAARRSTPSSARPATAWTARATRRRTCRTLSTAAAAAEEAGRGRAAQDRQGRDAVVRLPNRSAAAEGDRPSLRRRARQRSRPQGGAGRRGGFGAIPYTTTGYNRWLDPDGYPAVKPPWGTLNAIDLNTGEYRWSVPLGEYPELTAQGHSQDRHRELRRPGGDRRRAGLHRREPRRAHPRLRPQDRQGTVEGEAARRRLRDARDLFGERPAIRRHRLRRRQDRHEERRRLRGLRVAGVSRGDIQDRKAGSDPGVEVGPDPRKAGLESVEEEHLDPAGRPLHRGIDRPEKRFLPVAFDVDPVFRIDHRHLGAPQQPLVGGGEHRAMHHRDRVAARQGDEAIDSLGAADSGHGKEHGCVIAGEITTGPRDRLGSGGLGGRGIEFLLGRMHREMGGLVTEAAESFGELFSGFIESGLRRVVIKFASSSGGHRLVQREIDQALAAHVVDRCGGCLHRDHRHLLLPVGFERGIDRHGAVATGKGKCDEAWSKMGEAVEGDSKTRHFHAVE